MDKKYLDWLTKRRNKWIFDPVLFCEEVLGLGRAKKGSDETPIKLDPLQEEILIGFAKLVRVKDKKGMKLDLSEEEESLVKKIGCSVQSGRGVGKTALSAIIGLWFLMCFDYARVIVLGPKYEQIKSNLWAEIAKWIRHSTQVYGEHSLIDQIFEMQADQLHCKHVPKKSLGKEWRMHIMTYPKNAGIEEQKASISGCHSNHMLFLIDESSGVPDHIFEPIESTLTSVVNLVFAIFNPNKNFGWAIQTQSKMKDKWATYHFDAHKSTLVSDEQIEYMRKKFGTDSNSFRVSVLGLPPIAEDGALIPWEWIQAAKDRWHGLLVHEEEPLVFGGDIGGGGDKSMLCRRHGMKVLKYESKDTVDTDAVANWLTRNILDEEPEVSYIDMNGIGNAVFYKLKATFGGMKAKGVNVRKRAFNNDKFVMLRDELFWRIRESFETGEIAIPPDDDQLEGELSLLKYDDEGTDGKIKIISKQNSEYKREMKGRLGYASPNKADALALTFTELYNSILRKKSNNRSVMKSRMNNINPAHSWMAR